MKNNLPLFAVAADNWKNDVLGLCKLAGYRSGSRVAEKLCIHFGHMKVDQITKQDIQKYIVKITQTRNARGKYPGTVTVRKHLGVLKGIMEYADDNWDMPTRLKIPKRPRPKQEFYTFEDVRKLLHESSGMLRVFIMLLAETGCRLGEALALQTQDVVNYVVNIDKNVYEGVLQYTPKTDSSIRKVCISKTLDDALKTSMISDPKGFIFRSPNGRPAWPLTLSERLKDVCRVAGVEYKAFHAFRRCNVTELCNTLGIPEKIVGMRVGHSSQGMTLGVYAKSTTGNDKIWVDKIEKLLYKGEGGFQEWLK